MPSTFPDFGELAPMAPCLPGDRLDMTFDEFEVNDTLVKSVVTFAAVTRATFQAATISENSTLCSFQRLMYEACAFFKATAGLVLPSNTMSKRTVAACIR
jgi:hypothetical protein